MLYAILAVLALISAAVVAAPLLRGRSAAVDAGGHDVALYRAQLDELADEQASGAIGEAEAAAARVEIERRLLRAADRAAPVEGARLSAGARRTVALSLAAFVLVLGGLTYRYLGNPGLHDSPAVRQADVPAEEASAEELAVRMADVMRARPDDLRGWLMLGPLASSVGRYDLAADAYANAARLEPGNVDHWLALGQAAISRDAGMVHAQARDAFGKALVLAPGNPMSRYYLGLADFQRHDDRAAFDRWTALAKDTPPDAQWAGLVARGLRRAAHRLGLPEPGYVATAPASAAVAGPSAEDMRAAEEMSGEDRAAMIEGMVQRLADRLSREPDDLDGWLRLGRAYMVLERRDDAARAFGEALRIDPSSQAARDALAALKGG